MQLVLGWGYCRACWTSSTEEGELPPCETDPDGFCIYTRDHKNPDLRRPFQLSPEESLALDVYHTARALSDFDPRGLPTLSNLELTLRESHLTLEPGQRRALLLRVATIHNKIREHEAARLANSDPSTE